MSTLKYLFRAHLFLLFLICAGSLLSINSAFGQTNTWDGSLSNNWNAAANWSLNLVPTAAHDVVIPNGVTGTITVNTAAVCKSFTMTGGVTSNTVTISGANSLSVTNGVTIQAATGGGTKNKILAVGAGTLSCASVTIDATGSAAKTSAITISTGTVTVTGSITMGDGNDDVTFSGAGTLNIGGTMSGGTFTANASTVNYNGTAQTIGAYTYYILNLAGSGVKTAAAGLTIGSVFTIGVGTTFTAGAFTHTVTGNWVNNGTFTNTGSTIDLDGAAQSIGGTNATNFNDLSLSGSGIKTFNFASAISGNLSISTGVVANLGTFTTHTANTLTLGGAYRAAGTWGSTSSTATNKNNTYFSATTGYITVATFPSVTAVANGNWTTPATWSCNCVPPAYSNVTIPAGINVTIPAFGLVDFTDATDIIITVNGTLTLNNATLLIDTNDQLIVNTGGSLVSAGFFGGSIFAGANLVVSWLPTFLGGPGNFGSGTTLPGPLSISGGALPITLLYFKGRQDDKEVILEWASASEENFDYYRIEKSLDGLKFEELNRVKGSPFSTEKKEYSLVDPYPVSGKIYYRLVSVDLDGTSEQFQVIMVNFVVGEKRVYVYPNPVVIGDDIVVQPNFGVTEGDALIILNNLGQQVYKASLSTSTPISVGTSAWGAGLYFVTVYSKDGKFTEKVIVR